MVESETYGTVIGCIDGKVQEARAAFVRQKFGVEYVDTINRPGMAGKIVGPGAPEFLQALKEDIEVSLNGHQSKGLAVSGHQKCLGNPVPDEQQREEIRTSAVIIKDLIGGRVPVIPIFVVKGHNGWEVEEL